MWVSVDEPQTLTELTSMGTCSEVLTMSGEMMLASRMPRGLAEEGET